MENTSPSCPVPLVEDIIENNNWKYKNGGSKVKDEKGRILNLFGDLSIIKPVIVPNYFVTRALTNEKEKIYGIAEDCYISDWSHEGNSFFYSDVVVYNYGCGYRSMLQVVRTGERLVNPSCEELTKLHEQSKVNIHQFDL